MLGKMVAASTHRLKLLASQSQNALQLAVSSTRESGCLGVILDSGFKMLPPAIRASVVRQIQNF